MNIYSKWLRGLFAALMLCGVCLSAGCADADMSSDAAEELDGGESLEELDAGSDDIGGGGFDNP